VTDPLVQAKRRIVAMLAVIAAAMLAACGFAWGFFVGQVGWMLPAAIAALLVAFGVQILFIAGVGRADKGARG